MFNPDTGSNPSYNSNYVFPGQPVYHTPLPTDLYALNNVGLLLPTAVQHPYQVYGPSYPDPSLDQHFQSLSIGNAPAASISTPANVVGWGGQHISQVETLRAPGWGKSVPGRGKNRNENARGGNPASKKYDKGHKKGAGSSSHRGAFALDDLLWRIRRLPRGARLLDVLEPGLKTLDSRAVAALLKELSKDDPQGGRAHELFDWVTSLPHDHPLSCLCDVYTYTAMISICANSKQVSKALELWDSMQARAVPKNVHTFSALMNVCIKCGEYQLALKVFQEMCKDGCVPNRVTYHTLIDVYGKTGQWREALAALEQMKTKGVQPDTRTYNTLMIACNTSGQWQEALGLYKTMLHAGHAPNTVTYNALIAANSKAGRIDKVLEIYQEMVQEGCERSVVTYSSLISACEKAGRWELALQLFDKMQEERCAPNVITYNALITACAQGSQWQRASELFDQMQREGCRPDVVTYTALISAYERAGKWMKALQAFEHMKANKCKPDSIVYSAIIDGLWDTGVFTAQRHALQLCQLARSQGLFHRPASSEKSTSATTPDVVLHSLNPGVAMTTLYCWLIELREAVLKGGEGLPARLSISVGRKHHTREPAAPQTSVRETVMSWLQRLESPFRPCPSSEGSSSAHMGGMVEAEGEHVATWLSQNNLVVQWLSAFQGGPTQSLPSMEADQQLEQQCLAEYSALHLFESTHRLDVSHMAQSYVQLRGSLITSVHTPAVLLGVPPERVSDAVLLMDRFMSLRPNITQDMYHAAMWACLWILVQQSKAYMAAPSLEQVACVAGVPPSNLQALEIRVRIALNDDSAAISAHRCLLLYLKRIGPLAALERYPEVQKVLVDDARQLIMDVRCDSELLNYRPSVIAAAVLYCQRMHTGVTPYWPAALAGLTDHTHEESPELMAAIAAVCRFYRRWMTAGPAAPLHPGSY